VTTTSCSAYGRVWYKKPSPGSCRCWSPRYRCVFGRCFKKTSCRGMICPSLGTICSRGRCIPMPLQRCSLKLCLKFGAKMPCKKKSKRRYWGRRSRYGYGKKTTCGHWARKSMKYFCDEYNCEESSRHCKFISSSRGKVYCNRCEMIKHACKTGFKAFGGKNMPSHAKCSFVFGKGCYAKGSSCTCKISRSGCKKYNKRGRRCLWVKRGRKCMCPMKYKRRRDEDDDDDDGPPGRGPPGGDCDDDDDDDDDDDKMYKRRHGRHRRGRKRRGCPKPSSSPNPSTSPVPPTKTVDSAVVDIPIDGSRKTSFVNVAADDKGPGAAIGDVVVLKNFRVLGDFSPGSSSLGVSIREKFFGLVMRQNQIGMSAYISLNINGQNIDLRSTSTCGGSLTAVDSPVTISTALVDTGSGSPGLSFSANVKGTYSGACKPQFQFSTTYFRVPPASGIPVPPTPSSSSLPIPSPVSRVVDW